MSPVLRPFHPRHRIDIRAEDLLRALASCARPGPAVEAAQALEAQVDPAGEVIATLSARSGFDLLLSALDLPAGSEILFSALTIPDMARITRAHGLVPVPIDVDPATLAPTRASLEQAWSPAARVLVVARLLGARPGIAEVAAFARERGLFLVDDDAQGFTGPASLGPDDADSRLSSFGSIKTMTTLGGGLIRVRDPGLGRRMRRIQGAWPEQPVARYARKLGLYLGLIPPRDPRRYALLEAGCALAGRDLDRVMTQVTRGFPVETSEELLRALRHRPCGPLLGLIAGRLARFERRDRARIDRRQRAGEGLLADLGPQVEALGAAATGRTHWLCAVLVDHPGGLLLTLRAAGFDAARGATSLVALDAPPDRPAPHQARRAMERVLFLPAYPEIPAPERARMARIVRGYCEGARS
jgi:dTDP-4-amino-4,6-dideoxygalactose transaminase